MVGVGIGVGIYRSSGNGWNGGIYMIGESYASMVPSAYGVGLIQRLAGDLAAYSPQYDAYPGQGSTPIKNAYLGMPLSKRRSILVLSSGRNSVLTNPSGTRQDIIDTIAGCKSGGRYIVCEIPLKTTETVGADFDTIVAHNAWLAATFPGRVVAAQDLAQTYPSGDTVHISDAGYDVWAIRISNLLRSLGWLNTALPSSLTINSMNVAAASRYVNLTPGTAQPDSLPQSVTATESTWAVWYKSPSGTGAGYLWGRSDGTTAANRMCLRVSGGSGFAFGGSTFASAAYTLDTGWHLYAMRIRNNSGYKVSLWIDGTIRGSEVATTALGAVNQIRMAESSAGTSFQAQGLYCDPCCWNVALSNADMLAMFSGGRKAASALPQSANLRTFLDFQRIKQANIMRGVPDRCGILDAQAVNLSSAQLSTDIP